MTRPCTTFPLFQGCTALDYAKTAGNMRLVRTIHEHVRKQTVGMLRSLSPQVSTVTAQSQHSHSAQSQHSHGTAAAQAPQYSHSAQSQHSHSTVTAQPRHSHSTAIAQPQHSHSTVTD